MEFTGEDIIKLGGLSNDKWFTIWDLGMRISDIYSGLC